MPVIAGTGTIDTEACIAMGLRAKELGADGTLVVTPRSSGRQKGASTSLSCSGRRRSRGRIALSSTLREMIARPDVSRTEWKTTERAGGPKLAPSHADRAAQVLRQAAAGGARGPLHANRRRRRPPHDPLQRPRADGRRPPARDRRDQGRKRVIQRCFNVSVFEAKLERKAPML